MSQHDTNPTCKHELPLLEIVSCEIVRLQKFMYYNIIKSRKSQKCFCKQKRRFKFYTHARARTHTHIY